MYVNVRIVKRLLKIDGVNLTLLSSLLVKLDWLTEKSKVHRNETQNNCNNALEMLWQKGNCKKNGMKWEKRIFWVDCK